MPKRGQQGAACDMPTVKRHSELKPGDLIKVVDIFVSMLNHNVLFSVSRCRQKELF